MKDKAMGILQHMRETLRISKNPSDMYKADEILSDLSEMAIMAYPDKAMAILEKWEGKDYKNYVTDAQLKHYMETERPKWSAATILDYVKSKGMPIMDDGTYNSNALVLAMNQEYKAHRDSLLNKWAKDETQATEMALDLAIGVLHHKEWVNAYIK